MMNISEDQKALLYKYLPTSQKYVEADDLDMVLDVLDAKITEIGLDDDQEELNAVGLQLQRLYDQLYNQN